MNYFDIANKEIDQDHFIEWLIRSYDSENELEKNASIKFLEMLIGEFENDEHIIQAEIKCQVNLKESGRIDFICGVKTSKNFYLLAIEDKIEASVNNDLIAYAKYISNNKKDLIKRLRFCCAGVCVNEIKTIFSIIKTGVHLSKCDKTKIDNSEFRLVDRNMVKNCLKDSECHHLIGSFLRKISSSDSKLTDFSGKKEILCENLSDILNYQVEYKGSKYYVYLNEKRDYWLQLNNFSLTTPRISLNVFGETKKKPSSDFYKLIADSECKKIAFKREEIDSDLPALIEFLKKAIAKAL